jgi:hypothetical protein
MVRHKAVTLKSWVVILQAKSKGITTVGESQ